MRGIADWITKQLDLFLQGLGSLIAYGDWITENNIKDNKDE